MTHAGPPAPRQFLGVMISSTFADFEQHREALIEAISGQGLHPIAMEQDSALPAGTVIDSSLQKVRDGAAYIGIIGFRYGNIPDSAERNPERLSLTELEFREARELGRPVLLFIMGPDHDVKARDVELDPERKRKLDAFREDAKRAVSGAQVHRVYKVFNSLREFEVTAAQAIAELRRLLDAQATAADHPAQQQRAVESENSLFALASRAQQRWQDALAVLQGTARVMDRAERRGAAPPGIDSWEYVDQQAVHKRLAASMTELTVELKSQSEGVVQAVKEAKAQVEQLRESGFTQLPGRLAPMIESVSDLERASSELLNRMMLLLDDLDNRGSPDYDVPYETLSRARERIEDASSEATLVMRGLQRMQAGSSPRIAPVERAAGRHSDRGAAPSGLNWTTRTGAENVSLGGKAAAGTGTLPAGVDAGSVWVPPRYARGNEVFTVQVEGDSMIGDGLRDGDYVIVDPSQEEKDGDIVVVLVGNQDDAEAMIKRLWHERTTIRLESSNPDYPPITFGPEDNPRVAGKVTGVFRPIDRLP